jgi:hypothetical protein
VLLRGKWRGDRAWRTAGFRPVPPVLSIPLEHRWLTR